MIPILYNKDEKNFDHNGLGQMVDILESTVEEVENGEFEFYGEYPVSGRLYNEITNSAFIKAKPNSIDEPHIFRIYGYELDIVSQTVIINASTITNDLGANMVRDVIINNETPQQAFNKIKKDLVEPTNFDFYSDIDTKSSTRWTRRNPLNCIAGEEGSLLQYWGGEIKRENNKISLLKRRGRDNVTTIRQDKNLTGLNVEYSTKGMVTVIIPTYTYTPEKEGDEEQEPITLVGKTVESKYVNNYPIKYLKEVDYSQDEEVIDLASLNRRASNYFNENTGIDLPTMNMVVNIDDLSDSSEYEEFRSLENIELTDTVTVYIKEYGVLITAKVRRLVFDVLTEKNRELELGSVKATLYEDAARTTKNIIKETETELKNNIMFVTKSKNTVFSTSEQPTKNIVNGDLWYKPVGDGETEMYQFEGGVWKLILSTLDTTKVQREVEAAQAEAESAKQEAENAYNNAVTEAERLVVEQTEAFDVKFETETGAIRNEIQQGVTNAITNANAYTDKQLLAFDTEFDTVTGAIRTEIEQGYTDSVAEAERLVQAQTDAFNAQMTGVNQEISTVKSNIDTAIANVDTAISNVNQEIANNFTSLSDSISEVDDIAVQAKSDAQTALSNAQTAKSDAQTALSNASTALGKAQTAVSTAASANNKAIKSSVVDWALSSSGTTPPTTGWQTTIPTPSSTQYTWGRTTITLNDGTTILSYNVSKIGVKGDKGDTGAGGAKGDKGDAGVNAPKITSVKQYFYLSSSNTSQTGGSWTETIPVWSSGKYYWTRVVTSYDNATTTESVPVLDNSLNQSLVTSLEAKSATQTLSTTVSQHATQIAAKANQTTVDTLTGRVSTAEGSISVQAGQIALKANQTTVDTLTGRVGTAETNISANTKAINLRATKSSVDTLTGRVTTAEGTITAQAGQIALRATTATVNALTGRVSAAEASLSVQSGKIDLAATKTELTNAIDGIEVGGRNLVKESDPIYAWTGEHNVTTNTGAIVYMTSPYYPAMYQIEVRAIDDSLVGAEFGWQWSSAIQGKPVIISKEWKKATAYIPSSRPIGLRVIGGLGRIELRHIKVEKGNKATDWTPAPEDVDKAISTVQANLTVEAGKITALTTRVTGSETNISKVTQTVSGINTTISTLRTDVNGKATIVALNQVKSTADGNKTTISNHAGRLTTVETNVNGLQVSVADKVSNAQFTVLSNSVSSVVSDLNNLEIGGRNLLRNSGDKVVGGLSFATGSKKEYHTVPIGQALMDLDAGTEITISFDIQMAKGNYLMIYNTNTKGPKTFDTRSLNNIGTKKQRVSITTFVRDRADATVGYNSLEFYSTYNTSDWYEISKIKIEKGNKATDWTPAPEDMATQSQITQLSTSISTKVESSTYNSKMTQLDNAINLRVVQGDVTAAILADKKIKDTRTTNQLPSWYFTNYPSQRAEEFKNRTAIGLPGSSTYAKLVTDVPWTGSSGGVVVQTAYSSDGIYNRSGNSAGTAWGAWVKQTDSANVLAQVNLSTEGVLIQGKRIQLDGDVTMTSGFIYKLDTQTLTAITANITSIRSKVLVTDSVTSTHLKVDNALIDTLTATTTVVDRFFSKTAVTNNLTTKTLAAITANITSIRSQVLVADVITSTHLKVDNALIDALTATTAVVDRFFSKTAVISNLSTKTLSAITANITSIRSQILVTDSVTSTHIKAENALIDSLFATTALITRLTSKTAFINNIKAIDISADRITAGTLNAANVSIINLNVSKLVGNKSDFVKSAWNGINTRISIDATSLTASDSAGNQAIINASGEIRSTAGGTDQTRGVFHKGRLWFHTTSGSAVLNIGAHPVVGEGVNRGSIATARAEKLVIGRYNDYLTTNINAKVNPYITLEYSATIGDESNAFTKVWHNLSMSGKHINDVQQVSGYELSVRATSGRLMLGVTGYNTLQVAKANTRSYGNMEMMPGYSVTGTSDERLKNSITPTSISGLKVVNALEYYDYYWNDRPEIGKQFGLIAQRSPFVSEQNGTSGYWGINMNKLSLVTAKAVKEVDTKVSRIDTYVTQHELEIKNLKLRIKQLEEKLA